MEDPSHPPSPPRKNVETPSLVALTRIPCRQRAPRPASRQPQTELLGLMSAASSARLEQQTGLEGALERDRATNRRPNHLRGGGFLKCRSVRPHLDYLPRAPIPDRCARDARNSASGPTPEVRALGSKRLASLQSSLVPCVPATTPRNRTSPTLPFLFPHPSKPAHHASSPPPGFPTPFPHPYAQTAPQSRSHHPPRR